MSNESLDVSFAWTPYYNGVENDSVNKDTRGNLLAKILNTWSGTPDDRFIPEVNKELGFIYYQKNYTGSTLGNDDITMAPEFEEILTLAGAWAKKLTTGELNNNKDAMQFIKNYKSANARSRDWIDLYWTLVDTHPARPHLQNLIGNIIDKQPMNTLGQYKLDIRLDKNNTPYLSDLLGYLYQFFTEGFNGEIQKIINDQKDTFKLNLKTAVYLRNAIFPLVNAKMTSNEVPEVPSESGPYINFTNNSGVWYRDTSKDTSQTACFYKMDDGKKVYYGKDDDDTKKMLKQNNNCYQTGMTGSACFDYIHECLLDTSKDADKSLEQCMKTYNFQDNFFTNVDQEIKKMHPIIAVRTLQKFGFRTHYSTHNNESRKIKIVESVDHWMKYFVKGRFGLNEQQAMNNQKKLLDYLQMLVDFVNSNPGILNKDIKATSNVVQMNQTPNSYADSMKIPPMPIFNSIKMPYQQIFDLFRNSPNSSFGLMGRPMNIWGNSMGSNGLNSMFGGSVQPGGMSFQTVQSGGSKTVAFINNMLTSHTGAPFIKELYDSLINDLKMRNKTLNQQDAKKLLDKIEELGKIENDLLKSIAFIEKYNHLLAIFGNNDPKVINMNELEQFVNSNKNIQNKHISIQQLILRGLEKLGKIVDKEDASQLSFISM